MVSQSKTSGQLANQTLHRVQSIFKLLSEDNRIRVLTLVDGNELTVSEIQTVLKLKQSTLSVHLNHLKDCGLLKARKEGKNVFYQTNINSSQDQGDEMVRNTLNIARKSDWYQQDQKELSKVLDERRKTSINFFDSDLQALKNPINSYHVLSTGLLALLNNQRIIDLGCGSGELLASLATHHRNNELYGLDSSSKQVQLARKHIDASHPQTPVKLIQGDMECTGLEDCFFDIVIMSHSLHHVAHPIKAIKEVHRILKDKGKVLIFDLDQHDDLEVKQKYGDFWMGFDEVTLKGWLSQVGFKNLSYQVITEGSYKKIKPIVVLASKE